MIESDHMGIEILATGSYVPTQEINNLALFERIHHFDVERARETLRKKGHAVHEFDETTVFDLWVKQVCGVARRYFYEGEATGIERVPQYGTEYMGYKAAMQALERSGLKGQDIDQVIFCSFTQDQIIPNPGCTVAHFIGASGAKALHINTACSGFLDGLGLGKALIESGAAKRVLVVASEHMSNRIDFGDVTTAILFGDGAACAILENKGRPEKGILSFETCTDYHKDMLSMDFDGPLKMAGGPLVQRNAVNAMYRVLEAAFQKAGKPLTDIDVLVPHQANLRILNSLADKLNIPYDRMVQTIVDTGNVSAASIGIGLDRAMNDQIDHLRIREGHTLGLTVVGGGYTFSGLCYVV